MGSKTDDNLVIIDDSIVHGPISKSILTMLDRLGPKKIVVVRAHKLSFRTVTVSTWQNFKILLLAALELHRDNGNH